MQSRTHRMRKMLSIFPGLLCALALLLSACGGGGNQQAPSSTTKAPDDQQIFISPINGKPDVKTLDPALAYDIVSINSAQMLFTGLVQFDDNLKVKDQLAASHQVAADGTTWTFKLKDNLKFSDGSPITATDVVYSIDRALQPATKSGSAPFYLSLIQDSDKLNAGKIKTIIGSSLLTPDDKTVVIKTSQKSAYFLDALAYVSSYVVPKSVLVKYGNQFVDHLTEGIGVSGPWMLTKHERGKDLEFVPNPNYYGAKAQLKKVIMPFYPQEDTVYKAYEANQVHSANIPSPQLDAAKGLSDKQFRQSPQLWEYYYSMNMLVKPFDNTKIRQAFALAINKDVIAHNIYKDTVIATNHLIPSGMPGYNDNITGPQGVKDTRGDAVRAKQIFDEGLKEEGLTLATLPKITITYASGGDTDSRNAMSTVQQMWKSVLGVDVIVNDEESSKYFDDVSNTAGNAKGLQMWLWDWIGDYPDPQDWTTLLYSKGAAKNNMNYGQNGSKDAGEQQAVQQLLAQADANPNQDERLQQYNQAEQKLLNDVVVIPMYQETSTYVLKPCVVGVVDNAQQFTPPDDWGNIYISTANNCADVNKYK
jgi:oligopeptide transport system substrate-binding protein